MHTPPPSQNSHLFMLKLWAEMVRPGEIEWRGRLQHVVSGEVRYFHGWPALISQIEELLAAAGAGADPQRAPE